MSRPQSCSLAAMAVWSVLAGGACSDSTGGNGSPQAQLALQPQFPSTYTPGAFDLAVDRVRVWLIRPPAEAVVDTVVFFPSDATELTIRVKVRLLSPRETMNAVVVLSAGSRTLFAGTREVEVTDVPSAPTIPLQYVGPGTEMTSLRIEPRDSALRPGESFTYRVYAFNGATAVQNFYVGWSTGDPSHVPVDATGALVAPGERGSFMLHAVSPTGIKDSTRVWVSPPASAMTYVDGDGQTGAVLTQLPVPLTVQVTASDALGAPGVPVRFTALSGGTVREPVVTTDANGFARSAVVLGPIAGPQLFEASVPGFPTVTFRATATAGLPAHIDVVSGDGQTGIAGTTLAPFIVLVTDEFGNPLPGVTVRWNDGLSSGELSATETTTAVDGRTSVIYRLPSVSGTVQIRAEVPGTAIAEIFTATVAAPPTGPSTR